MELYNDEVPGSEVWATVTVHGDITELPWVDWFITAEASSEAYVRTVAFNQTHSGGSVHRWKVTLPRRRMTHGEVTDFVTDQLVIQPGPTGTTQLLDVSIQKDQ